MTLQTLIALSLTAAALSSGCANTDTRLGSSDARYAYVHSNENMYAVIDAIETIRRGNDGSAVAATSREDTYRIRMRFDDRSYQR